MFKRTVTAALVFGTLALAPPAQAMTICAQRSVIVEKLESGFHESYQGAGLQSATSLVEIWSSEETGSWTMLLSKADGTSCVIASGMSWQFDKAAEVAGIAS